MFVYHEIDLDSLKSAMSEGLKRTTRGDKGNDDDIVKTDQFLDDRRPSALKQADVSRDDNLYAYYAPGLYVIDITDGAEVDIESFIDNAEGCILRIEVDPTRCYVSDLDIYDEVKRLLVCGEATDNDAGRYWKSMVSLQDYDREQIRRPEVMIPYDISPAKITDMSSREKVARDE